MLEAVVIEPSRLADSCVIWLHGLGADGHDFAGVIPSLNLPSDHRIRFIFPHAAPLPVTINGGMIMPAWYDISALDLHAKQDENGIRKAEQHIKKLIYQLVQQGIEASRILLIGFSQGGAIALHTALRFPEQLAGVAGLSTYLPLHDLLSVEKDPANQQIDIFMAHGLMDPVVPYWMGQKSFSYLQNAGFNPHWHVYPMVHTVCFPELNDLGKWIDKRFARIAK